MHDDYYLLPVLAPQYRWLKAHGADHVRYKDADIVEIPLNDGWRLNIAVESNEGRLLRPAGSYECNLLLISPDSDDPQGHGHYLVTAGPVDAIRRLYWRPFDPDRDRPVTSTAAFTDHIPPALLDALIQYEQSSTP